MYNGKKNLGFTMIELLIVLAFFGIFITISIPKLDFSDHHLRTQAKILCNEIREVRMLRMTEGEDFRIVLSKDFYQVNNGIKQIKRVNLRPEYKLYYNFSEIKFSYNTGAPTRGDTITIRNIKNKSYMEITIVPSSGRVLLKDEVLKSK